MSRPECPLLLLLLLLLLHGAAAAGISALAGADDVARLRVAADERGQLAAVLFATPGCAECVRMQAALEAAVADGAMAAGVTTDADAADAHHVPEWPTLVVFVPGAAGAPAQRVTYDGPASAEAVRLFLRRRGAPSLQPDLASVLAADMGLHAVAVEQRPAGAPALLAPGVAHAVYHRLDTVGLAVEHGPQPVFAVLSCTTVELARACLEGGAQPACCHVRVPSERLPASDRILEWFVSQYDLPLVGQTFDMDSGHLYLAKGLPLAILYVPEGVDDPELAAAFATAAHSASYGPLDECHDCLADLADLAPGLADCSLECDRRWLFVAVDAAEHPDAARRVWSETTQQQEEEVKKKKKKKKK